MHIKVVSFNIRNCNDPDGNSVAERVPRLRKVIKSANPDIMGFQEYKQHWHEHLGKTFLNDYDVYNVYRSSGDDEEAVPLFWRKDKFECVNKGHFWLSDTPEVESRGWDEIYNCYRICAYVVLREKGSDNTFTFMNTHFGFGNEGQVASAELIAEYSKELTTKKTIIIGDFNMTPSSPAYKKMTEYFLDVNAATVNDSRATFHGYDPQKHTDALIDFCFVSGKIKPINYSVVDTLVDGKYPSDHYGILAEVKI